MEPDQDPVAKLRRDSHALAAQTGCDHRTAARWLKGERVASGNEQSLKEAAMRLGIERTEGSHGA